MKKARLLAPTSALDLALDALAHDDAARALRWAVPALADEGSGAVAADLVGRACALLGDTVLAVDAHERAVEWLVYQGMATHAVASALALRELTGTTSALTLVARAFGVSAAPSSTAPVPALHSVDVDALPASLDARALMARARTALEAMPAVPKQSSGRTKAPFWSTLSPEAFVQFAGALVVRITGAGEVVMSEGARGTSAFLIARGDVRVHRALAGASNAIELAVVGAGGIVGEMALVTDAPRVATVTAARACLLLEASREAVDDAAVRIPALGELVLAFCRRRLLENVTRTAPLLREVPADEREGLVAMFETRTYDTGQSLIVQGETGAGLHLLAAGTVDVVRQEEGGEQLRIASLGPGHCLGEISLVLRRPANASVVAAVPTVSLVLPAARFMELVHARPNLLATLYDLAVRREDETMSVLAQDAVEMDDAVIT